MLQLCSEAQNLDIITESLIATHDEKVTAVCLYCTTGRDRGKVFIFLQLPDMKSYTGNNSSCLFAQIKFQMVKTLTLKGRTYNGSKISICCYALFALC